jgi:hypothetical protein
MERQAAQPLRIGHFRHQRMEGGGDRREVREGQRFSPVT